MRDRDPDAGRVVDLYLTCKAFGALPDPGGVLQQDPELMAAFGVVEAEVERAKVKASTRRHGEHGERGERQRRLENGDGDD